MNDLDCSIVGKMSKFADDTKLGSKVHTRDDCDVIQQDLEHLSSWSDKWLINFNEDKCKVMHIGQNNVKYNHKLHRRNLIKGTEEKDLGVIITNDLKCAAQCLVEVVNQTLS